VGLANIHAVLTHLNTSYGEDRYRISPLIQRQVFQGKNIHG
jgi:3-hydroxybutyryl-CoA dehydrogenase